MNKNKEHLEEETATAASPDDLILKLAEDYVRAVINHLECDKCVDCQDWVKEMRAELDNVFNHLDQREDLYIPGLDLQEVFRDTVDRHESIPLAVNLYKALTKTVEDKEGKEIYLAYERLVEGIIKDVVKNVQDVLSNVREKKDRYTDELTGLHSLRFLKESFSQIKASNERAEKPTMMVFMDLDNFKSINDRYGHGPVDENILKPLAKLLKEKFNRKSDMLVRRSGDEFIIVLSGAELNAIEIIEDRLKKVVDQLNSKITWNDVKITISAGIVSTETSALAECDFNKLVNLADGAMYLVKDMGKDGVLALTNEQEIRDAEVRFKKAKQSGDFQEEN